jgi:tRNA(fMet)-specific endonuclease VapC
MKYLLDTDTCIYLIKKRPVSVIQKLSKVPNSKVALSVISVFELQYGVENSQYRERSQQALNHFLEPIQNILPVDQQVAGYAAKIRAKLKVKGAPIGPYDLLIAASALSQNLTLVSNNIREFKRIDGLKLENWSNS